MTTTTFSTRGALAALAVLLLSAGPDQKAEATEGGGTIYPVGTENYLCCAVPPPGLYGMVFAESYLADKLKDNDGNTVPLPGFKVTANVVAPRVVWVTPVEVAGASLAFHVILPIVALHVDVPNASQRKTGIGDVVFGPALGWHLSSQMHTLLAADFFAPTGAYDKNDLANIGRNYWAGQLIGGFSYIDPAALNADAKAMYTVNARNNATGYHSGNEVIVDYSIGWGVGHGLVAGVGGYLYQQVTDDKLAGATVPDNRGRALAIGPSFRYDSGKGWFVTLKYEVETEVRNRAEGKAFWLKAVFPL